MAVSPLNRSVGCVVLWILGVLIGSSGAAESAPDEPPRWNPAIPDIDARNLLPNGGFECGTAGWSGLGRTTAWGGDLTSLHGEVVSDGAFHGDRCLRVELGPGKTPVTHFDGWPSARVVQAAPLAAQVGWLSVEKGERYTLSAWMRADREGVPATLVFRFGTNPIPWPSPSARSQRVVLTQEWARYSFTVAAEEAQMYVAVGPDLTDTPDAEAVVWIDAVQVEKGEAPTPFEPREPVEIGVETGRFGNVFLAADPVGLRVLGANNGPSATAVTVTARLEDYFGNPLPPSEIQLEIPSQGRAEAVLPLHTSGLGYYRARVTTSADDPAHERTVILGVIQAYKEEDGVFGINHAPVTAELARLMQEAGVVWARNCSFDWNQLEPEPGQRSFEKTDLQVDRERAQGFRSLAILPVHPSAAWNSSAPDDVSGPPWAKLTYAPKDPAVLYDFVGAAVAEYRGRIRHYEFINEPVWIPFVGGNLSSKVGYTVADYIDLLKGAYPAMKAADPDCVVLGGLSIQAEMTFGDAFIAEGGLEYCDVYNLHPYPTPDGPPERFIGNMGRILAAMDVWGQRKPIWATETAFYAEDDLPWTPWVAPPDHNAAANLTGSERRAADFGVRLAVILLAHGVEKIFYHQGIEGEVNNGSWTLDNPLFGPLATPQKFYVALAALANALGPHPSGAVPLARPESVDGRDPADVYGFAFDRADGGSVLAVWSAGEEDAAWAVEPPAGGEVRDVVGNAVTGSSVPLTGSPVYVLSPDRSAAELAKAIKIVASPGL